MQAKHEDQRKASQCLGILPRRDGKSMCFSSCKKKKITDMSEVAKDVKYHASTYRSLERRRSIFTSLSRAGIEATTEVLSDDLLRAKSTKGTQAANDFEVSRCSPHPTLDYIDES